MIYYDRIDVSEGIDLNYWYFLDKRFQFQSYVCNRCRDLVMMSMNLSGIAIVNVKSADYCCIINGISKNEAINLMQNADLTKKSETLQNKKIYYYI